MGFSKTVQSVFAATLCAQPAAAQVPARGMKELEPRVFVVDDDHSVQTSLANLLATKDYVVEIFASAEEYLARVPHPGPACVVLEVQLPGLGGLALQRQLTDEARTEQIVFITRHGDIPTGIGAMKRGAVDADWGGVLVGVYRPADPRKYFLPLVGLAVPVTAALDFAPSAFMAGWVRDVTLALYDPTRRPMFNP